MSFYDQFLRVRFPSTRGLLLLGLSLTAVIATLVVSAYAFSTALNSTASNCNNISTVYKILDKRISAADKLLGTKGSAGYQYYKDHPAELAAAHREDQATLNALKPPSC